MGERVGKIALSILIIVASAISYFLFAIIKNEGGVRNLLDRISQDNKVETVKASGMNNLVVQLKENVLLDAPIVKQFPELPRGCEVTSLAMLLQYKGIDIGKMELAERVIKNTTPLKKENGTIYWGNPNDGYIGDMYSYSNPGYGVYHKPIKKLAEEFLPGQIIDLTGRNFEELKTYLSLEIPVWVIINTTYQPLSENAFETWKTPSGEVKITYKEHSVLITGYDNKYIYFNDPITGIKNLAKPKDPFIEAWKQMGSQAISLLPDANTIEGSK
ncbi:C39 family peptidase [Robertmurraya sp. GLU-23]|uniref:C39 family peptidase n=1 Tax=Robertmurraya beringensis TaxID=641660 RepID=A0ABV6KVN2_9BACI